MKLRNVVITIVLIAFVLGAFICLYSGIFMEWAARKVIGYAAFKLADHGIVIRDPDFSGTGPVLPPGMAIYGFSAHFVMTQHNVFQIDRNFFLTIEKASLSLTSIRNLTFTLTVKNALVRLQPEYGASYLTAPALKKAGKDQDYDRLEMKILRIPISFRTLSKKKIQEEIASTIKEMANLAKYGTTGIRMEMEGATAFVVREEPVSGKLLLVPHEDKLKIVMDEKDFRVICAVLQERLTGEEFKVYCNNPFRLPRMLRIRNYASDQAHRARKKDAEAPEEAYKHVLWAYLLVKAYDEKFSAEVTDTHEIGALGSEYEVRGYLADERGEAGPKSPSPTKKKTPEEIQMDLRNNAIGRDYAKKDYTEDSLLGRVMKDPDVVRSPYDLDGRSPRLTPALPGSLP